ncbi:MAG: LysM domain-containing protein [Planctomycetota bacterium]|nr:LysM domain-containing protein [Planctomycetota bacterium]
MEKLGARHWLGALALALPALLFLPGIGFETQDPAALARRAGASQGWYYRVRSGDSLTTIAERELGTFKRFKEILALNPGIKPRSLQVGDALRMPPRKPGEAKAPPLAASKPVKQPDSRRLMLSIAGLLGLVLLIVLVAGRLERRAYERG